MITQNPANSTAGFVAPATAREICNGEETQNDKKALSHREKAFHLVAFADCQATVTGTSVEVRIAWL